MARPLRVRRRPRVRLVAVAVELGDRALCVHDEPPAVRQLELAGLEPAAGRRGARRRLARRGLRLVGVSAHWGGLLREAKHAPGWLGAHATARTPRRATGTREAHE